VFSTVGRAGIGSEIKFLPGAGVTSSSLPFYFERMLLSFKSPSDFMCKLCHNIFSQLIFKNVDNIEGFGAHTKRLLDQLSPLQNVSIQNVYTHNVSLTKHLLNETSPVTERLRNKTSPGLGCANKLSKQ
jgi:hypothetical protein